MAADVTETDLNKGFEPVGDNWFGDDTGRPVLYIWGVPPARRVTVARFLPEFRTAFVLESASWAVQLKTLDLTDKPTLAIWGNVKNHVAARYASTRGVDILRLDDGFLHSEEYGKKSRHQLSMIVDRTGMYFDGDAVSDLERLLLTHDFEADTKRVEMAGMLRRLYCLLGLSKYTSSVSIGTARALGPKIRKRVLVIGQIWNSEKLIDLAKSENPQAEILYTPHPDVSAQLRNAPEDLQRISGDCRVLLDPPDWPDLFTVIDHVYTLNSAHGFDALIYGCKVTATGAPFYAGWGLTDDRLSIPRRGREVTLDQLFCAVFLLYPRYLADLEDTVTGCLAAMLYIAGNRQVEILKHSKLATIANNIQPIGNSRHWPILLRQDVVLRQSRSSAKAVLQLLPAHHAWEPGPLFKRSLACFILGSLQKVVPPSTTLSRIQSYLSATVYAAILEDLIQMHPSRSLKRKLADCCEQAGDTARARAILLELLADSGSEEVADAAFVMPPEHHAFALQLAQMELKHRNLDEAERLFNRLLLAGNSSGEVFCGLADVARLRFDFRSAAGLMSVFNYLSPGWKNGRGAIVEAQMAAYASLPAQALEAYASACLVNAEYTDSNAFGIVADVLKAMIGDLPYGESMHKVIDATGNGSVIGRAKALTAHQRPDAAEALLSAYNPSAAEAQKYCLMLSQAYVYQGKLREAKSLVEAWLIHHPVISIYREGFQIAILMNDYAWGWKLLQEAMSRNLNVGDNNTRRILLGLGRIHEGYRSFRDLHACGVVKNYLGERYVQTIDELKDADRIVLLSNFGPGDEIRFSSFYGEFADRISSGSLNIACDPRLFPLLERSYPEIAFTPVARARSLAGKPDYSAFKDLPGSELHSFTDNEGWKLIQDSQRVTLITDLLADVIDGYESFPGVSYLTADGDKVSAWTVRLHAERDKLLVGISWRSSLTTNVRIQHYLTVEELAPIFEIPGIQFVNLQYDDCSEELAWINQRFPGKMLNFPDLDQYNDFDGVAALMSNLDLVVAPCTTVLELAGSLGRPSMLLSNSSELHWRKLPGSLTDVWHNSVQHVESSPLGDKASLVVNLAARLRRLADGHYTEGQRIAS